MENKTPTTYRAPQIQTEPVYRFETGDRFNTLETSEGAIYIPRVPNHYTLEDARRYMRRLEAANLLLDGGIA